MRIRECLCPVCFMVFEEDFTTETNKVIDPLTGRRVLPCRGKHTPKAVWEAWRRWFALEEPGRDNR